MAATNQDELVERARSGDYEAFEHLVSQYAPGVYHTALRITRNPQDSEEVLQETFLAAYRKLDSLADPGRFKGWLYRIASNAAFMKLRSGPGELEVPTEDPEAVLRRPPAEWRADPEVYLEEKEMRSLLLEALAQLGPAYRAAFWLKDVEGLSNPEVAEALGLTLAATKSRVLRARLQLRGLLADYFERPREEIRNG